MNERKGRSLLPRTSNLDSWVWRRTYSPNSVELGFSEITKQGVQGNSLHLHRMILSFAKLFIHNTERYVKYYYFIFYHILFFSFYK